MAKLSNPAPDSPLRRIALVMQPWAGYLQEVRLGITEYLLQKPDWRWTEFWPSVTSPRDIIRLEADGCIAFSQDFFVEFLKKLPMPVVDVSNHVAHAAFPTVVPDDIAIGKVAAEYLLDLGLKQFAFAGFAGVPFSELRQQSFTATLHKAGFQVSIIYLANSTQLRTADELTAAAPDPGAWLKQLPNPIGLFAVNDSVGMRLLELCRQLHLSVPDALCVLGADDDELLTRITYPPLSSIPIFGKKVGFEAARLLDELMSGRRRKVAGMVLPPGAVVARQSTNLLAIPDPDVLAAVRFIRDNIHKHLTVAEVLQEVPVNRRYLERKFWTLMGRTPLQEIRRVRLEQTKRLLLETDLSMPNIARQSGFRDAGRMASVFRHMTGMTPTQFRRQFRLHDRW